MPQAGGGFEIDFPDGKTLLVTPEWWASQSEWYLNVDVTNLGLVGTDAAGSPRGIAGAVPEGSWLPALPSGASLGPMPAALQDRYLTLYRKFADTWRRAPAVCTRSLGANVRERAWTFVYQLQGR